MIAEKAAKFCKNYITYFQGSLIYFAEKFVSVFRIDITIQVTITNF